MTSNAHVAVPTRGAASGTFKDPISGLKGEDVPWSSLEIVGCLGEEADLPKTMNDLFWCSASRARASQPVPADVDDLADKAVLHAVCERDGSLVYAGRCRWLKYEEEVVLVEPEDKGILAAIREAGGEEVGSSVHWYHVLYEGYDPAVEAALVEAYRRKKATARGSKTKTKRKRGEELVADKKKRKQEQQPKNPASKYIFK
ncbi:hypothetical protein C8R46DRAFT_1218314 [Mycena filopes]|nr:hypothetical protein C8R46DRAFT_1218314 [Mycena filopes]